MKRAILFDFWQTLVVDTRERQAIVYRQKLVSEFLSERGFERPDNLIEAFEDAREKFFAVYSTEQRTATVMERLNWIFAYVGHDFPEAELKDLEHDVAEAGLMLDPLPTPNVKEVVPSLCERYPLGIVSDTGYTPGRVLRRHLQQHGLLDCFSAFSFSDETGHGKPSRASFMTALDELDVKPENAIHCGDLPQHDIIGANALGITSVLYTGHHFADLDGIKPDFIISDWRELPAVVDQVFC